MNRLNSFKERLVTSIAYLLPKGVAYWAFIRVATFECRGNPSSQSCGEAIGRWKDPERSRRAFLGAAFAANADELTRRKTSSNEDPIHELLGTYWFWDETWGERIGPYSTEQRARDGAVAYGEFLNNNYHVTNHAMLPDILESDPRHPLNINFERTTDGTQWAKAFINRVKMLGLDFALDEATVTGWFATAIERGRTEGAVIHVHPDVSTVSIKAMDSKTLAENGPAIAEAIHSAIIHKERP